ncbi:efflux RND transporter periplasmic adaptor subunit [Thermosulfuriphilus sp.]
MKKTKVLAFLGVLFLVIGAIGLVKTKKEALKEIPPPPAPPLPVKTVSVTQGRLEITEHYLGTLEPLISAQIATKLSGFILKISKYEGDSVKKGELLVEIEAQGLRSRIQALKAELRAAQTELLTRRAIFKRNQKLLTHEALSQEAFDLSKSAYEQARARVEALRQELKGLQQDLSYARLRAPFSGLVSQRLKDPGDLALPGEPILKIEAPQAGYRLLVEIPQEKASRLKPQARAYLRLGPRLKEAKVFRIFPAVGPGALAVVEIRLKRRPFGLPSGASIGVDLVWRKPEGLILPLEALARRKPLGVYAVRENRLVFVPIRVLGRREDLLVCQGDLSPGEAVVLGDPSLFLRLHSGQTVRPIPKGQRIQKEVGS